MKSSSLVRVVWAMGFLLPAAVAAAPHEASACGSAIRRAVDVKAMRISEAEQQLGNGLHSKAAAKAVEAFPAIKTAEVGANAISDRALRILALANVRTNGAPGVAAFPGSSAAQRTANLTWSIDTLRALNAKRANNPTFQTDLGEALAKVPKHQAEAAKILSELASKDLMTSAEGYAALARLRAESGDAAGREAAVKRCEGMAKIPKTCGGSDTNSRS